MQTLELKYYNDCERERESDNAPQRVLTCWCPPKCFPSKHVVNAVQICFLAVFAVFMKQHWKQ